MAFSDLAETLNLFRDRRDNPVAMATLPWRGSPRRRALFWGMLAAVAAASILGGWSASANSAQWDHTDYFHVAFAAIPFLTALSLQLFGFRHREGGSLEDLALSALTRREVAFGAVYGGVVASGWMALPVLAGSAIAAFGTGDDLAFEFIVLALLWPAMVGVSVRAWILAFGRVLYLLVYVAAFAFLFYSIAAARQLFSTEWDVAAVVVMAILSVALLAQASKFAGLRFFAPLDWEALCRAYWLTNELVAFFEFDERRKAMRELRARNKAGWTAVAWGWALGAGIVTLFVAIAWQEGSASPLKNLGLAYWIGSPVPNILAAQFSMLLSLYIRYGSQEDRLWMAAGSIHASMGVHVFLPVFPFFAILVVAGIRSHMIATAPLSPWHLFGAAALTLYFAGFNWLTLVRGPRTVRWTGVVLLWFAYLLVHVGICLKMLGEHVRDVQFQRAGGPMLGKDILIAISDSQRNSLVFLFLVALVLLAFWPRLCQSIHQRQLARFPRHSLVQVG